MAAAPLRELSRRGEGGLLQAVDQPHGRASFFMLIGVVGAAIFLLLILLNGLSPFLVPICA